MIHLMKYGFKRAIRQPILIFWILIFPIILATLFKVAFSNIKETSMDEPISILVDEKITFLNNDYLNITYINNSNETLINNKLNEEDYLCYVYIENNEIKTKVTHNGIKQTIFINILEKLIQNNMAIEDGKTVIQVFTINDNNKSFNVMNSYFFSLLGMLSMFGAFYGIDIVNASMPSFSPVGARLNSSPTKKSKYIFSSLIVSYLVFLFIEVLVMLYINFVLKINLGSSENLLKLVVLVLTGSFTGITFGMAVATIKASEVAKIGIVNAITMSLSALSGLYSPIIKYKADKYVPFLNKINPTNLINDSLLAINYFDDSKRYMINITLLLVIGCVFSILTIFVLRRRKYEYI